MLRPAASILAVGMVAGLIACSDGGTDSPSPSAAQTTTTSTGSRTSDGVLRLGVLLPSQILSSTQQNALRSVLTDTVQIVNARGGFRGKPIELFFGAETGDPAQDKTTVDQLLDVDGIDALIGPSSSSVAERLARDVTAAGVGVCSPAATSIRLADLPDDNLMIRTVPSDATIARAMVQLVAQSGFVTASLLYPDDPYGRAFLDVLHDELATRDLNQPQDGEQTEDVDIAFLVDSKGVWSSAVDLESLSTRVILVVGNGKVASDILARLPFKIVIANDGFVDVNAASITNERGQKFLESMTSFKGVTVDAYAGADEVVGNLRDQGIDVSIPAPIPFLTNFVDCANVMMLSALTSNNDDAREFMTAVESITTSGTKCSRVDECLTAQQQGLNFDYDGPTGELDLDGNGEVVNGSVLLYTFGSNGKAIPIERIRVRSGS